MVNDLPLFLWFTSFTISLGSFQYGYHIGELNTPKDVMSCKVPYPELQFPSENFFPPCIKMEATEFSFVTSVFTIGGLLGSLFASKVADGKGRRWALFFSNIFLATGSLIMGFASSIAALVLGRLLVGVGSGVVVVVVPTYLVEISTLKYRGAFGVMNQLGIVIGILAGQVLGLYLSTIPGWRAILLAGAAVSFIQILLLGFVAESPRYLASKPGGYNSAKRSLQRLRGNIDVDEELNSWKKVATEEGSEGLISRHHHESNDESEHDQSRDDDNDIEASPPPFDAPTIVFHARNHDDNISIWKFIMDPQYLPVLRAISLLQLTQQFSGINAVIFYSTTILSKILPGSSDLITVYISIVNTFMTIVSAILIDKAGRKVLLLFSISSMAVASAVLALSIVNSYAMLSAISIIAFVATFAIGLGPVPFVVTPEIVDTHAAATASSLALSLNWASNFTVAFLFLGLREIWGGNVFFIFSIVLTASFFGVRRYVPETKDKSVEEVWRH